MRKAFEWYAVVILVTIAIVALLGVLGIFFTKDGTGTMDNAFHDVVDKFAEKVEVAKPGVKPLIPEGATYYDASENETLQPGDEFPAEADDGDIYRDEEYEYRYNYYCSGYSYSRPSWSANASQNGWGVRVIDASKPSYGQFLSVINGAEITNLERTYYKCEALLDISNVTVSNRVTTAQYMFGYCTALTTGPDFSQATNLMNMDSTFYNCDSLVNAPVIPNHVETMVATFSGCDSLTDASGMVIPESVTNMRYTFYCEVTKAPDLSQATGVTNMYRTFYCSPLKSIVLGDGISLVGEGAFEHCYELTSVTLGNGVTAISKDAFNNCTSLSSITIPDSVTSIGEGAFCGCTSLTDITIPDSVTSIGKKTFWGCTSLTDITFEGTVDQWNAIVKGGSWKFDIPATEVVCSDGTVSLS